MRLSLSPLLRFPLALPFLISPLSRSVRFILTVLTGFTFTMWIADTPFEGYAPDAVSFSHEVKAANSGVCLFC